jgi:hypothetical protein
MSRFTACGLSILLAFAPAALAVDGTVLINQSTITNGLTGCPTGGHFPVLICQGGSYRLSGNLTVPDANTDAIDITADNVTVDLNGFSILGPVVCSNNIISQHTTCSPNNANGIGIFSPNSNSFITVSNGTIRGLGQAIALAFSGIRIEGIKAISNGFDGIEAGALGSDAIITLCQASTNGGAGFSGAGTLSNSSTAFNNGDGVNWFGSATGTVSRFNGGNGFEGSGAFINNLANGNLLSGIKAGVASVIISNTVYFNPGASGISAPGGSVVSNNVGQ